jgi:hypothetical protein
MELISLIVSIVALVVSVGAVFDVRKRVKKLITLEYHRSYAKVLNDMAWTLLEPTGEGYSAEIEKSLEDFSLLSRTLEPGRNEETPRLTVEREALVMANKRVQVGVAKWKPGLDRERLEKARHEWQNQKNKVRLLTMLGELDKFS